MARLVRAVLASSLALTLGACSMLPQQKSASHPAAPVTAPEEVSLPENITPIPSEMPQEGVTPPADARKSMVIWGSGVQIFVCAQDQAGRWWQFLRPDVSLRVNGRELVNQGGSFTFTAADGSRLNAHIVANEKTDTTGRTMADVRFATQAAGRKGMLTGTKWVTRTKAKGGMPLTLCSPSEVGKVQRIPFQALYTFYK